MKSSNPLTALISIASVGQIFASIDRVEQYARVAASCVTAASGLAAMAWIGYQFAKDRGFFK